RAPLRHGRRSEGGRARRRDGLPRARDAGRRDRPAHGPAQRLPRERSDRRRRVGHGHVERRRGLRGRRSRDAWRRVARRCAAGARPGDHGARTGGRGRRRVGRGPLSTRTAPSSALTSFVVASRYLPVYIAVGLLVVVAAIWAPATLRGPGLSAIAPFGTFLALTALGEMLVIMTGGIDLSVPGTLTLAAVITVGVGHDPHHLWGALVLAVALAALVGLVNGILIAGLGLNALIVTLAVGQIVL